MLNNTLKFAPSTTYSSNFTYGIGENTYQAKHSISPYGRDLFVVGNVHTKTQGLAPERYVFNSVNTVHKFYLRANYSSSLPLRFTMAYTDYPGTEYASDVMVNILELSVIERGYAANTTYTPYVGHGANNSVVDNVQMIDIPSPISGALYVIQVTASRLQVSNQTYALVVTGAFALEDNGQVSITKPAPTPSPDTDDDANAKTQEATVLILIVVVVVGSVVIVGLGGVMAYLYFNRAAGKVTPTA
jgi:hypothetical protein